jgi:hypothetical protein
MYLDKETYIWEKDRKKLKISGLDAKINIEKVKAIVEEAGYWRKANAIHKWFVDNVQEGVDDCKSYYVEKVQLQTLLDTVNEILKDYKYPTDEQTESDDWEEFYSKGADKKIRKIAEKLLPTESGFFFGETSYDGWYFYQLVNTKKILEEVIAEIAEQDFSDFYYRASW